jgi:F-type H+-transporting ATPase subunit b
MPQIQQLPFIYASQLFWLLLVFGTIFFVIGRGMLPKIQSTVEARDQRIAEDLATAESARAAADETEAAYRARIEASRGEALKVTQAAKQATARETEERLRAADAEVRGRVEAAEGRIRASADAALWNIESVAADAARDMVAKLAGIEVSRERAAEAVKAVTAHG